MSCHAILPCHAMQKHRMNKKLAAAEERGDDSNSIQSNPARGGVNRLIIPVQEQIEQVDRRHQQAVSVRPLWLWVDTSTQALQYPFSRDFRAAIYIDPCRIPMNSIISFRVCAESCIHRGVRYAAIISSVGSLTIACLLQGKGSQKSRGTCMQSTKQ